MSEPKAFEGWAIVELMGHRRLGGYVTEVEVAGSGMLRVDVPGDLCAACHHPEDAHSTGGICSGGEGCECVMFPPLETELAATQFYSSAALYCLTPTTEETARSLRSRPAPVQRWELPALPAPALVPHHSGDDLREDLDDFREDDDDDLPL